MMIYFKRFLWITFFLTLAAGAWGYYNGLRPDNYKEFFAELIKKQEKKPDEPEKSETGNRRKNKLAPDEKHQDKQAFALQPAPRNPFAKIDKMAENVPSEAAATISTLAEYLQKNTTTDIEKARAIYTWLAKHIDYDDDGFNTDNIGDMSAPVVLETRKAVCEGFSNLYVALGHEMGLEIKKVIGYAKGYGYSPGKKFKKTDHAWNIIKIDGTWRVFDATWGEGYGETVNGKLKSKKAFNDFWFNTDPYEAIFSHLPENHADAFIQPAISLGVYEKLPPIEWPFFEMGFDAKTIFKNLMTNPDKTFPEAYASKTYVQVKNAPAYRDIKINTPCQFEFFIPRAYSVSVIDNDNNWTYMENKKGVFRLNYTPDKTGDLYIAVKSENGGEFYNHILKYNVAE